MSRPTRKQLAEATIRLLAHKPAKEVVRELAGYLIAERRSRELTSLLRDIETLRYEQQGILEVTATSARELSAAVRKEIEKLLPAPRVDVHYELKPEVIGGVRVRALDRQLDDTIAGRLEQLKHLTKSVEA